MLYTGIDPNQHRCNRDSNVAYQLLILLSFCFPFDDFFNSRKIPTSWFASHIAKQLHQLTDIFSLGSVSDVELTLCTWIKRIYFRSEMESVTMNLDSFDGLNDLLVRHFLPLLLL